MPLKIDKVDMDLEVLPAPAPRDGGGQPTDAVWKVLRSSAFREVLRPLILDIVSQELDKLRRRFG